MVTRLVRSTLLLLACAAFAQDPVQQARAAFNAGEAAYNLGQFDEALKKYEEAYRLSRLPPILFNLGQAHRRIYETQGGIDHLRNAREFYRAYLREVPISPQGRVVQQLLKDADAAYALELRRQRERLLGSASGPAALALAGDFLEQGDRADAAYALDRFFKTPRNSRAALVTGYLLRARIAFAEKRIEDAEEAFARALALDPAAAPPPSLGPEIERIHAAAKRRLGSSPPLTVRHVAPGEVEPGRTPVLRVQVESDPLKMIERYALHLRSSSGGAYSETGLALPPSFASLRPGTKMDYYIEVLGREDSVLQSLGTART